MSKKKKEVEETKKFSEAEITQFILRDLVEVSLQAEKVLGKCSIPLNSIVDAHLLATMIEEVKTRFIKDESKKETK